MGRGQVDDLTGRRFGRLTVLSRAENRNGVTYWLCKCDCGNEKEIRASHLKDGGTTSCGCYCEEVREEFYKIRDARPRSTRKQERLYRIWKGLRSRCNNKNYPKHSRYGGRGITVCKEWDDYLVFKIWALENGYSDELQIDRIDNDGNYGPSNCRWVTSKQNCNNKSTCHYLTVNGTTHTLSEWADITGVPMRTIWMRIKYGLPEEKIIAKGDLRNGRKRNCKV